MTKKSTLDPSILRLDLPDPKEENISSLEFLNKLEKAWSICDRFDLQTEIWRGRILRVVRDREKRGKEGTGSGFLQWLREMEISKSRAYSLIQLADSADNLVGGGMLEEGSVNNFSKRAFIETAQSVPEVQQMISDAANDGKDITRKQVRRLSDEFMAVTSPLLPDEIKERTQTNLLPSRVVAPLVKELAKLPKIQQDDIKETLQQYNQIDSIKEITNTAKWIGKSLDASFALRVLDNKDLNIEKATQEAQRLDLLGLLSDAFSKAKTVESSVLKLYSAWSKLSDLQERLWVESGSSTPYLREILENLQTLTGTTIKVSMGGLYGGKKLRLQIVVEDADQLEPPSLS